MILRVVEASLARELWTEDIVCKKWTDHHIRTPGPDGRWIVPGFEAAAASFYLIWLFANTLRCTSRI